MVRSAGILLREKGFTATGMREIAAHADAPRGSLQHYFPDGKQQVVTEAMAWVTDQVTAPLTRAAAADPPVAAAELVAKSFRYWRRALERSNYFDGCPIVTTVTHAAANDGLRTAAAAAFGAWRTALAQGLRRGGLTKLRADRTAALVISALEGAIVVARAERDLAAFDAVAVELKAYVTGLSRTTK